MGVNKPNWKPIKIKLGDLKMWEDNPRYSTVAQAKRIIESEKRFNQVIPFIVSPYDEDEKVLLYDGHQRALAWLTVYGADHVMDAMQCDRELTDEEHRELVITLHAGAAGAWDWNKISAWDSEKLQEWGFDKALLKDWNTDATNLKELLNSEKEIIDAEPQIDRAAELNEKWQVKTGDLWRIGEHRLLCGDSTRREDVERVMGGEKAGATVTDPPYGINRDGIENDNPEGLQELFDGCLSVMPIENAVVIAFQSPRLFPVWLDAIRKAGHKFERMLWMYKRNDVTNVWRGWLLTSEAILLSTFGKAEWEQDKDAAHDCYMLNWEERTFGKVDGWHASIKPLDVVQNIITHTVGDVYEPFAGSGTTIVACQNLNRKCRAIEISPAYCAVILERMATAFPGIEIERI